jgi:hypothetical protein
MKDMLIAGAAMVLLSQGAAALALWAAKLRREAKNSSLAKIVGAASRVASRINDTLAGKVATPGSIA